LRKKIVEKTKTGLENLSWKCHGEIAASGILFQLFDAVISRTEIFILLLQSHEIYYIRQIGIFMFF